MAGEIIVVSDSMGPDGQTLIDTANTMNSQLEVDVHHIHNLLHTGGDGTSAVAGGGASVLESYLNEVSDDMDTIIQILQLQGHFFVTYAQLHAQVDHRLTGYSE